MAARTIDGPEGQWLTQEEVAEYLGVSVPAFRRLAGLGRTPHPSELAGVREWFRRSRGKGAACYHWLDVFALGHLLSRRPGREGGGEEK